MTLARCEALLKESMGLDAASIGSAAVERAVRERLAACGIEDLQAYWERLTGSGAELQALIDAVVVPETWFFRDREAFAALGRLAWTETLRSGAGRVLRLLSLPCSTGEEPYSMAMALLDAGLQPGQFRIDAIDISGRSLAVAHAAIYRRNSFRGSDQGFRERHFVALSGGVYRLADVVRERVEFRQGNLFELTAAGAYDFVFCRNLLIYFDRETQDRAVRTLERALCDPGTLFVGPSETGLLLANGLEPAKLPLAFAFRKAAVPARGPGRADPPRQASVTDIRRGRPAAPIARRPRRNAPKRDDAPPTATGLQEAERLADRGQMVEAMSICEAHVREHGPSAGAFYLMAVMYDASGRTQAAAEHYRKALYLEPAHHGALVHLAMLLERDGAVDAAQRLYERARRVTAGGSAA